MNIPCKLFTSLIILTHRSSIVRHCCNFQQRIIQNTVETVGKDQLTQPLWLSPFLLVFLHYEERYWYTEKNYVPWVEMHARIIIS
jgi:hypothetical protein